jgi:hypothetical protein
MGFGHWFKNGKTYRTKPAIEVWNGPAAIEKMRKAMEALPK